MRICVVGAGGVGGFFGGQLAKAGHDVLLIARGAHLEALRTNGLSIQSATRPLSHLKVQASDRLTAGPAMDLVLLCVKLWDTEAALELIEPVVGPQTCIVSLQNGVEAVECITRTYGAARTMGGLCHIAAELAAPGVIKHTGMLARITLGEVTGEMSPRVKAIETQFAEAGIDLLVSSSIAQDLWEKMVFLSSFAGVTTAERQPIGRLRHGKGRAVLAAAVDEGLAVARAVGAVLPDDGARRVLRFIDGLPPEMKSSMLVDLERGARLELPWLSGAIVGLGKLHGVPTPTHAGLVERISLGYARALCERANAAMG